MKVLLHRYNTSPFEINVNDIDRVIPNNYIIDVYLKNGDKFTGSLLKFADGYTHISSTGVVETYSPNF